MDWEIIYSYTRKRAIEDGVLIDVSKMAREAGFKVPVAITAELWGSYVATNVPGQDLNGRLWDILFMLFTQALANDESIVNYDVIFRMNEDNDEVVTLKAIIAPGDNHEPVITIMMPHED
jgi:hypothetical protein